MVQRQHKVKINFPGTNTLAYFGRNVNDKPKMICVVDAKSKPAELNEAKNVWNAKR
jgi:hypothetical protein